MNEILTKHWWIHGTDEKKFVLIKTIEKVNENVIFLLDDS